MRHSDDTIPHGDHPTFKHDQRINKSGRKLAKRRAKDVVSQFGKPDIIYCSPFLRARETCEEMKKIFGSRSAGPAYRIDSALSRFFTDTERKHYSVDTETLKYKPPINESHKSYRKRCLRHFKKMEQRGFLKEKVVLCITHAVVLKQIAKYAKVTLPEHYDFMETFAIQE